MLTELLEVITATVEGHCKLDTGITLEELPAEGGIYAELGDGFEESTSYNKQEVKVIPVLFLCRHPNQKRCLEQINEMKSYYALPVEGGGGQSGLDLLFHTLEGMAKR